MQGLDICSAACDHCPVLFEHLWEEKCPTKLRLSLPSILQGIKECIATRQELSRTDWDFELAFLNSSDAYDKIASIIHKLTEESVPLRTGEASGSGKSVWLRNPPCRLIRERKETWHNYKSMCAQSGGRSNQTREALSHFITLNRQVRTFHIQS